MDLQPPIEAFQHYLEEGRIMLQRGRESGKIFYYPRTVEPGTGATDLDWVEVSGMGSVYSTTTIRQRPPASDYNLALIDLDEGPRMMSRVENIDPALVTIGMRVRARITRHADKPLVVFDPAEAVASA
jgi:uncharacterized OB-fold protein